MKIISFLILLAFNLNAQNLLLFTETAFVDTLGTEKLTNGTMELNSNWTAFGLEGGDVSERSSTQKHGGSYSWHINVDAIGEGISSDDFTIQTGKTYWVSFWYYIVSGSGANIAPYNGYYSGTKTYSIPIGAWTYEKYKLTGTGNGADKLLIRSNGTTEFYIDDISVKELL